MGRTTDQLLEIYRLARQRFGHQNWWHGQTGPPIAPHSVPSGSTGDWGAPPLEVCVGAILTQNTAWMNVAKALDNLRAAGLLDLRRLHEVEPARLAELIRPAGYFNIKARRLKNFIARVMAAGGDLEAFLNRSVPTLREELLAINGIGRETADSIILYAARKCSFVVDAYTCRVLLRHGLIGPEDDYESVKELIESNLPCDLGLFNDFHAQFVAVGKNFCKPTARCEGWGPQARRGELGEPCPLEGHPHDRRLGGPEEQ